MTTRVRISAAFARPTAAQLAALAALGTATLQDAAGGRGVLDPRIKPLRAGMRVCGPDALRRIATRVARDDIARPGDFQRRMHGEIVEDGTRAGTTGDSGCLAHWSRAVLRVRNNCAHSSQSN